MVDIILVRTSFVKNDPRVFRIVKSLSKRYSVLVLGWNRKNELGETTGKYVTDIELFNYKGRYGRPSRISLFFMIFYFGIYWWWVLFKLIKHRPKVTHACDLDAVLPCLIYKLIFRKKMVFDATVKYALAYIPTKFSTLYSAVNLFEDLVSTRADVLMNGWEKELSAFRRKPKRCVTIMNCAEDHALDPSKSEKLIDSNGVLKLVYTGGIRRERSLENIAAAVKGLNDVEFVLAGVIIDKELFAQIIQIPNVKYSGFLHPVDALTLEANADVLIGLYDLSVPWNSTTTPNKVFEAMMCGIPIITNAAAELVKEVGCGIIVGYDDVEQIRAAIISLRNKELRTKLGRNGRRAYLEKYNWTKMEEKLFEVYQSLMQK